MNTFIQAAQSLKSNVLSASAITGTEQKRVARQAKMRSSMLKGVMAVALVVGLSGCSDMSRFADAVGGAASEFTCALLEIAFTCDTQ